MKEKYYSLFELLKNEPKIVINKIYSTMPTSIWACQAIFQSLSSLSRYVLMRLLFLEISFKISDIYLMINKASDEQIIKVFDELRSLDLIIEDERKNASTSSVPKDLIDLSINVNSFAPSKQNRLVEFSQNHSLYNLNKSFQKSLIQAITNPTSPWFKAKGQSSSNQPEGFKVSKEFLEEFRVTEWNKVLSYLVGLTSDDAYELKFVPMFLEKSGLFKKNINSITKPNLPTYGRPMTMNSGSFMNNTNMITAKGYEFLLKDYYHQVWDYVTVALSHSNKEENMSLLFMLSYTTFGEAYSTEILTKSQNLFLFELSQVGIIYLPDVNSKFFYPTKTIINLIFGSAYLENALNQNHYQNNSSSLSLGQNQGYFSSPLLDNNNNNQNNLNNNNNNNSMLAHHNQVPRLLNNSSSDSEMNQNLQNSQLSIIVETNFQVIAYVTNDLHVALLRFFVDIAIRMPNMVVGRITRDKSKEAFRMGMKSEQIIDFFILHAHPVMKNRTRIIPENICDQLILWESELSRMVMIDALVIDFTNFIGMNDEIFELLMNQLRNKNLILWEKENLSAELLATSSSSRYLFACHHSAQEIIQNFLAEYRIL